MGFELKVSDFALRAYQGLKKHKHTHTQRDTHTHTPTHTDSHRHTPTHTDTHRYTPIHTQIHTDIRSSSSNCSRV